MCDREDSYCRGKECRVKGGNCRGLYELYVAEGKFFPLILYISLGKAHISTGERSVGGVVGDCVDGKEGNFFIPSIRGDQLEQGRV